jgi:hypothetical protein
MTSPRVLEIKDQLSAMFLRPALPMENDKVA